MNDENTFIKNAKARAVEIDRERQRLQWRVEAVAVLERALVTERQKARERLSVLDQEMQHLPWLHLVKKSLMAQASPEAEVASRIATQCAEQLSDLLTRAVSWMLHPPPFATAPAISDNQAPRPAIAPRMEWIFEPERRRS